MVDVMPGREWPDPGLYRDVDVDWYDELTGRASASILRTIHNRTPAHARALMDGEAESSEETEFSKMMHEAIVQPDRFLKTHIVDARCPATASDGSRCERSGRIPYRSQEGDLLWFCGQPSHHPDHPEANPVKYECTFCEADPGEVCTTHSGTETNPHAERLAHAQAWSTTVHPDSLPPPLQADAQVISEKEAEKIGAMRDALQEHPSASHLLFEASGFEEVTILFEHQRTGGSCKARMDRLVHHRQFGGMVVDYKIVENAQPGPDEFGQVIQQRRYDMQGQFYCSAYATQGIWLGAYAIVAQENEPPYAVAVHLFPRQEEYDNTVPDLEGAEDDVLDALREFKQCTMDGEWPAYGESLFLARVPSDADTGSRD